MLFFSSMMFQRVYVLQWPLLVCDAPLGVVNFSYELAIIPASCLYASSSAVRACRTRDSGAESEKEQARGKR